MHLDPSRAATIVAAIASIGSDQHVLSLGAKNIRAASRRTLSFDIPAHPLLTSKAEPTPTVNRIKVTGHGDGTISVRLVEANMAESIVPQDTEYAKVHEESDSMPPAELANFLKANIGLGQ